MKASERHLPDDLAFEDLEEEWDDDDSADGGPGLLPWLALLVLAASTAGIGMGLSWLFAPSSDMPMIAMPNWLQRDSAQPELPVMTEVADLPVSNIRPNTTVNNRPAIGQIEDAQATTGSATGTTPARPSEVAANLRATRDFTDSPELSGLTLRDVAEPVVEEPQAILAAAPSFVAAPLEVVPPDSGVIDLGDNKGEGNFLVLVSYQNDASLTQARQVVTDAFVRQMGGETYIQVAAFSQLEYARHMADELQAQGLSVTITQ